MSSESRKHGRAVAVALGHTLAGRASAKGSERLEQDVPLIRYKDRQATNTIILHDSHTTPEVNEVEDVARWKSLAYSGSLDMGLLGIGYHYIVERDGEVVVCQPHEKIGAHTPGHNLYSIGICLVGGRAEGPGGGILPSDNFTGEQLRALMKLLKELVEYYPDAELVGHTEVQRYRNKTLPDCPCLDMELIRDDLALYLKGITL